MLTAFFSGEARRRAAWWLEAVTGTLGNAVLLGEEVSAISSAGRAAVASRAGPTGLIGGEPGHAPVSQGPAGGLGGGRGLLGMTAPAPAPLSRAFASRSCFLPRGRAHKPSLRPALTSLEAPRPGGPRSRGAWVCGGAGRPVRCCWAASTSRAPGVGGSSPTNTSPLCCPRQAVPFALASPGGALMGQMSGLPRPRAGRPAPPESRRHGQAWLLLLTNGFSPDVAARPASL